MRILHHNSDTISVSSAALVQVQHQYLANRWLIVYVI